MEITSSNFNSTLPEIEGAIRECLFLSLDCELSGLNIARNINSYDTPREYYKKMRANSKDFLVMQFGLSAFKYNETENKFIQRTYNFYIFRRPVHKKIPDDRFLCQSSSIDFLINHSFDFNKLFKDGLSYLNQEEEDNFKTYIQQSHQKVLDEIENGQDRTESEDLQFSEKEEQFVQDVKDKVNVFLRSDEDELELPRCNGYFRRLVYKAKEQNYFGGISLETRIVNNDRILFAVKLKSLEEQKRIAMAKHQESLQKLEDFVGFTKILKLMIKSNKLIIGHNLALDFFHTIKFLIPLPESYEEFKQLSHALFSRVLDTKYMAANVPFKDLINSTVLGPLLEILSKKPFKLPEIVIAEPGRGYSIDEHKEHEAGYDSFITGLCFLAMWKHIGLLDNKSDAKTFSNMDLLEPYMNRIFLMKLLDNQYIHLSGEELQPPRDHVFYLTFPKEWTLGNLQNLFSPFGNISVSWIDETSAYVGIHNKNYAKVAFKSLKNGDAYKISSFEARQAQLLAQENSEKASQKIIARKKRKSSDSPSPSKSQRIDDSESSVHNSKNGGNAMFNALLKMSINADLVDDDEDISNCTKSKVFNEDDNWN